MGTFYAMFCSMYGPHAEITAFGPLTDDEFPELEEFVIDTAFQYRVRVHHPQPVGSMKERLRELAEAHPAVVAIFMGTRASDKGTRMKARCQWTDNGWPLLYRVNGHYGYFGSIQTCLLLVSGVPHSELELLQRLEIHSRSLRPLLQALRPGLHLARAQSHNSSESGTPDCRWGRGRQQGGEEEEVSSCV